MFGEGWLPLYVHEGAVHIRVGLGKIEGGTIETTLSNHLRDEALEIMARNSGFIFSIGENGEKYLCRHGVYSKVKEGIVADKTIPLQPDFDRQAKAKRAVNFYIETVGSGLVNQPTEYEIFVVWFSSVLKNWKAMVSTTIQDGRYYEVTYNGEKDEIYIDVYDKTDNVAIAESDRVLRKAYLDNINE